MLQTQAKTPAARQTSPDETTQRLALLSERFEVFTRHMVQVTGATVTGLRSVVQQKPAPKMK
jgi:hypothetical protein